MNNIAINSIPEFNISAKIIRVDGSVENLGKIVGGNFLQKILSYFRVKVANLKHSFNKIKI